MTVPFEVRPKEVADLGDPAFVLVLNALLALEAQRAGIPPSDLDLSWKQHTPDGGIDASIKAGATNPDWIPQGESVWQFKSGNFRPAAIESEIADHPLVIAALGGGARYVLALSRESTQQPRVEFEQALESALAAHGFAGRGVVLTGDDVARWASTHLSVAPTYFGHPLGDLMTYNEWAAAERDRPAFEPTDQQREFMAQLSDDFTGRHHGNPVSRIEGLSGVGKTRLALEAVSATELRPLVVFAPSPKDVPTGFLGWMRRQARAEAILVIDECDADQVATFSTHVTPCGGRLQLVTIGDGPRIIGAPPGRYYLDTAAPAQLEPIVTAAAPSLSNETRALVARLASGFIRAAVQIARNYAVNPALIPAQLADTEGVKEFLDGLLGAPDADTLSALSGASLFTHLPVDDARRDELEKTAAFVGLTPNTMRDRLDAATSTRVVQKRGSFVYVTPEILAIRLAAQLWGRRPASDLLSFYVALPTENARERFLRRLASLGDDERTRDIVGGMLNAADIFGDRADLYVPTRSKLARYLTEAHPVAGLAMLERLLGSATVAELLGLNGGRRDVVATLEKLVWLPDTFEGSARLLLALAEAENERYSNNATGIWHQLFRPYLSGTAVPSLDRLALLERILFDLRQSPRRRELALEGLLHAFESHVSRGSVMDSLGGKPLPDEWRPRTVGELRGAMTKAFALLERAAAEAAPIGTRALDHFTENFRMIIGAVGDPALVMMRRLLSTADSEFKARAAGAIGAVLAYDRDDLPGTVVTALEALRDSALVGDYSAQLRRWLGKPSPEDHKLEIEDPGQLERRGRELADEAWNDKSLLEREWAWLVSPHAQRFWQFFVRLGELDAGLEYTARLESVLGAETLDERPTPQWSAALEGHRRAGRGDWVWQRIGLLSRDPRTSGSALDALWRSEPSEQAAMLIAEMIRENALGPQQAGILIYGNWIGKTTQPGAVAIVDALVARDSREAYQTALSLLGMRLRPTPEERDAFGDSLWKVLEATASENDDQMGPFNWSRLAKLLLEADPVRVAAATLEAFAGAGYISERDERVEVLVDAARRKPAKVWQLVMESYSSGWKSRLSLQSSLGGRLLGVIPMEVVEQWVEEHGEQGATDVIELTAVGPELSEVQRKLLIQFSDSKTIRSSLLARMHTGVFSGEVSSWHAGHLEWIRNWARDSEPAIRNWAMSLIPGMEAEIRAAQQSEAEEDL